MSNDTSATRAPEISADEACRLAKVDATIDLIDVRTPAEYREVHAVGARNVPLESLDANAFLDARDPTRKLCVLCQSGSRARQAAEKLRLASAGSPDRACEVLVVEGGTQAWLAAGHPVVRGKKTMSLERQVRLVAGGISLIGAVLALTIHAAFALIPAFIGAGLVFAALTDTCGMGMVLAKMPWNQVKGEGPTCQR